MSGRLKIHNWRRKNITQHLIIKSPPKDKPKNWQVKLPHSPPTKLPKSSLMSREHVLSISPIRAPCRHMEYGHSWRRLPFWWDGDIYWFHVRNKTNECSKGSFSNFNKKWKQYVIWHLQMFFCLTSHADSRNTNINTFLLTRNNMQTKQEKY